MIYYIDPQSYLNLAVYDHSLLENVSGVEVRFFGNVNYDCLPMNCADTHLVFSYSNKKSGMAKIVSYCRTMMGITFRAIRERPKVIHVQWVKFLPLDWLVVVVLHVMGIRFVHTAHNVLPHNPKRFDRMLYRLYYKAVDVLVVHSERTRHELAAFIGNERKIRVIHHGILPSDCEESECRERMAALRGELGIGPRTVVFSCLGYQNKYKGTDIVFRAWNASEVLRKGDCRLLVVGKNENLDYSAMRQSGNVHIVDAKVPQLDFDAYLRLSSVVLLPYVSISQSGVLFTALDAGVPVMVTDVGGLAEPLQVARVGWNIGAPQEDSLRAEMERLALNPSEIDAVRADADAFERVRQAYSWKEIGAETVSLYKMFYTK